MRRHHFGLTLVLTLLVAGLTANCGDSLTEVSGPDGRAQARPTVAFATADNGAGLSITTDKDDYSPGDTVWFTGAGWTPGDTLDIVLTDSTDTHNWTVGIDANGGLTAAVMSVCQSVQALTAAGLPANAVRCFVTG